MQEFTEVKGAKKKSALVAQQIIKAFQTETYRPGEKLPAERILAEQMKVSRTCVREALKALEVLGLVESKVGDGTYVLSVAAKSRESFGDLLSTTSSGHLVDVWEARAELEAVIAKLATKAATQKTITRLRHQLAKMRSMVEAQDGVGYLDLDREFHLIVARGADNPLLESIILPLIQIDIESLLEDIPRSRLVKRLQLSLAEHENLIDAIQNRDEEAAIQAVRAHFEHVRKFYKQRYW
jgi:DNA-binding FadR family transcriptional regulator